ncbi:hypothetical protein TWF481_009232 [Arthrobotrys musiformis]|uniref:Uncharacterized protein n=1 Tax=Arthrobotrys musiformis TaxID=47236 RepID=A0AAV9W516_9PEZI
MAANTTPSNALVFQSQGGGESQFSNSGQVDWVTLAGSSVKFTVDVLARLSKAGIEAFTLAASYSVLGQFKLGNRAEIQVYDSVGKLRAFSSFNSALYFGFGVKHIVRSLADSAEGLSIVSICAILSDFYGTDFTGLILREFFKLLQPPAELTPTLAQWRNLAQTCAGALSHSSFKHHLSGISRLYYGDGSGQDPPLRGDVTQIAAALYELNKVASGQTDESVFLGGVDCALIAAIASWLLDLNIEIRTEDQGQVLFKHTSATKRKRPGGYFVAVVFSQTVAPAPQNQIATKVSGYQRVVNIQQLFAPPDPNGVFPLRAAICTRVAWGTALREVVGEYLDKFLSGDHSEAAGEVFGELMLHSLFSTGETGYDNNGIFIGFMSENSTMYGPRKILDRWKYINDASKGLGLLSTAEKWFPECADSAFSRAAMKSYKRLLEPGVSHKPSLASHENSFPSPGAPELRAFTSFIWFLYHASRCLSVCEVDESILPSRAGLLYLYQYGSSHFGSRIRSEIISLRDNKYRYSRFALEKLKDGIFLDPPVLPNPDIDQDDFYIPIAQVSPLVLAEVVFCGRTFGETKFEPGGSSGTTFTRARYVHKPSRVISSTAARTVNGTCFVLNSLMRLTEDHEELGKILVFLGDIKYEGNPFSQILDDQGPYPVADHNITSASEPLELKQPKMEPAELDLSNFPTESLRDLRCRNMDNDSDQKVSIELLVSDVERDSQSSDGSHSRNSTLWAHYRVSKGGRQEMVLNVRPAEFVQTVISHTPFRSPFGVNRNTAASDCANQVSTPAPGSPTHKLTVSQPTNLDAQLKFKVISVRALAAGAGSVDRAVDQAPSSVERIEFVYDNGPKYPLAVSATDLFDIIAILSLFKELPVDGALTEFPLLAPILCEPPCLRNAYERIQEIMQYYFQALLCRWHRVKGPVPYPPGLYAPYDKAVISIPVIILRR